MPEHTNKHNQTFKPSNNHKQTTNKHTNKNTQTRNTKQTPCLLRSCMLHTQAHRQITLKNTNTLTTTNKQPTTNKPNVAAHVYDSDPNKYTNTRKQIIKQTRKTTTHIHTNKQTQTNLMFAALVIGSYPNKHRQATNKNKTRKPTNKTKQQTNKQTQTTTN